MKIACILLADLKNFGGVEVFTLNLLNKLSSLEHDCTLYLTKEAIRRVHHLRHRFGFQIRSLGVQRGTLFRRCPGLSRLLIRVLQKRNGYDLWQIMGAYPAAITAAAVGVPTVLRAHGDDIQRDFKLNYGVTRDPKRRRFVIKALRSVSICVAMTETMEKSFRELSVPQERIRRIPNMVNISRFRVSSDRSEVRRRLGIAKDDIVLITVGRYHTKKGHDLIPAMAAEMRKRIENFKWLLVGQGVSQLDSEIQSLDLADFFLLHEKIIFGNHAEQDMPAMPSDDLIALLNAADIFVFPTRLEGFPMVTIEALASGLPVVTTNSPGTGELFQHGNTAMLSDTDDMRSIVENTVILARDEKLRRRLSQNGLREVQKYDIEVVVRQYLALYRKLLASETDVCHIDQSSPNSAKMRHCIGTEEAQSIN